MKCVGDTCAVSGFWEVVNGVPELLPSDNDAMLRIRYYSRTMWMFLSNGRQFIKAYNIRLDNTTVTYTVDGSRIHFGFVSSEGRVHQFIVEAENRFLASEVYESMIEYMQVPNGLDDTAKQGPLAVCAGAHATVKQIASAKIIG